MESRDDISNDPFAISDVDEWGEEEGWEEEGGPKKKHEIRRNRLNAKNRRELVRRQYEEWEKRKKEGKGGEETRIQ